MGAGMDTNILTEIVDNAIASINNQNRLMANAARIKQLESEIAELKAKLARADRIAQAIKEHGLGFTDAANFVDDQDKLAREEAEAETHESARARELRQIEEDQADQAVLMGSGYRRNWDECGPAGSMGGCP